MPSQAFIDEVLADIARLSSRVYAEVGVPMFLIAEDISGTPPASVPPHSPHRAALLAAVFDQVIEALRASKPELNSADVSHAIELVADRYMIALAQDEFSRSTVTQSDFS